MYSGDLTRGDANFTAVTALTNIGLNLKDTNFSAPSTWNMICTCVTPTPATTARSRSTT